MREIVVTGGAGYIGSHIVQCLVESGFTVHVVDNLSTGDESFVHSSALFHLGDVEDSRFLNSIFSRLENPKGSGVIHAAGLKFAGQSIHFPLEFYEANTSATTTLLKCMKQFEINSLVFSSSSSVYGSIPEGHAVDEFFQTKPLSPYGRSKLFAESIINDYAALGDLNHTSLRYFNVIGSGQFGSYDKSIFNLLPNIYRAAQNGSVIEVFGANYDTEDGTCIRDYVDVESLAIAHVLAISRLIDGIAIAKCMNVGSGRGYSVQEIIDISARLTERSLNVAIRPGRAGDPAVTTSNCDLIANQLSWSHEKSIEQSILRGWQAWQMQN